jgi:N-acetylglucosamine-6-phosphate deacetylase
MKNSLLLKNCLLYNSSDKSNPIDILIEDSKINFVGKLSDEKKTDEIIDVKMKIAAPGLIDIHIQGAGGADILDGTEESLKTISETLARLGTTSYLGTTIVKPGKDNHHLRVAKQYVDKNLCGAVLLGFHIEGPFINPGKKGGLAADAIYSSSPEALKEILDLTNSSLKMMTIAPEMPQNLNIIEALKNTGVIPAFAHSNATYEETKKGFEVGINHITHIFNAMPGFHHRNAGALNAIFENDKITAQIISDGHHLHSSTVKLIYKILGPERCICITDGMHGMGLPEGKYFYNEKEYESNSGAARYLDGILIGSTMSLLEIILKFRQFTGCTFEEAINSASRNPARLLGLNKGKIEKGKDADIIILDYDNSLFLTVVNGKVVYKK